MSSARPVVLDLGDRLVEEGEHQQLLGLAPRHAARGQVEERGLVDRAAGRAVRALHVVGVDLELGLGEELAVLVEQQRLADLVAVGLLRRRASRGSCPGRRRPRRRCSTFLNTCRLSQRGGAVGDEDGVVVVEVAVADAGAGHMRRRRRRRSARRRTRCASAGRSTVSVKDLNRLSRAEPREDRRRRPPLVVAALRADMVEGGAVADLDLDHLVEARGRRRRSRAASGRRRGRAGSRGGSARPRSPRWRR